MHIVSHVTVDFGAMESLIDGTVDPMTSMHGRHQADSRMMRLDMKQSNVVVNVVPDIIALDMVWVSKFVNQAHGLHVVRRHVRIVILVGMAQAMDCKTPFAQHNALKDTTVQQVHPFLQHTSVVVLGFFALPVQVHPFEQDRDTIRSMHSAIMNFQDDIKWMKDYVSLDIIVPMVLRCNVLIRPFTALLVPWILLQFRLVIMRRAIHSILKLFHVIQDSIV